MSFVSAFFVLIPIVFLTSAISGVFGLAGGLILMAIMLSLLPVLQALLIHAIIQISSNLWRAILWRKHICFKILPPFFYGVVLGVTLALLVTYIPSKAVILIFLGLLPILAAIFKRYLNLTIEDKRQAFALGTGLIFLQMTLGVAGPLYDVLYNRSSLNPKQIVATKAFSQFVLHIIRIIYFIHLERSLSAMDTNVSVLQDYSVYIITLVIFSILGTSAAALLLKRMDERRFKHYSQYLILTISAICLFSGINMLLNEG
jgi:uncharacterized membrane protein YfcA